MSLGLDDNKGRCKLSFRIKAKNTSQLRVYCILLGWRHAQVQDAGAKKPHKNQCSKVSITRYEDAAF